MDWGTLRGHPSREQGARLHPIEIATHTRIWCARPKVDLPFRNRRWREWAASRQSHPVWRGGGCRWDVKVERVRFCALTEASRFRVRMRVVARKR